MNKIDFTNLSSLDYVEDLYEQYKADPDSLGQEWLVFFSGFELGSGGAGTAAASGDGKFEDDDTSRDKGAFGLVHNFRAFGHLESNLDPLSYERPAHPLLDISECGFSKDDMDRQVGSGGFVGPTDGSLRDLIDKLRQTYCRTIGVEFTEIPFKSQREWLYKQMEPVLNRPKLSKSQCHDILSQLVAAEGFEQFLHTKYLGHKRFSIEGGEAQIVLLSTLAESGAAQEVDEIVMGMAHRGRLNVLAHLLHKPYEAILSEFEGTKPEESSEGSGDVKYHQGFSHDYVTQEGREVHISLSPNPSHLELVNPVIEGMVYAKQHQLDDIQKGRVIPVLIHGDASFTGQGIVTETLNLTQLNGYDTGGTIHIIVNNQIGFTATPRQTRFTSYPSDVAKVIHAPVFHVNGDDPEAVVHVARMAMAFRQAFKSDVIIDLWCYRKYGHNESDDPSYTQPIRYKEIGKHPSVDKIYAESLLEHNLITKDEVEGMRSNVRERLLKAQEAARAEHVQHRMASLGGVWKGLTRPGDEWTAETAVKKTELKKVAKHATTIPDGFSPYRKLERLLATRRDMVEGKTPIDWGCAEMLAFGSLLLEGISIRLAGQDCQRGTFSHRHAVWHDVTNGKPYFVLEHLAEGKATFTVLNSMLSELAVVGFEYGISSADPWQLTIWEAQFGDFANMAQPIIDQYITSGETKWGRMSGLVMLLPHGYEGQGPEHSSARLERYLQLSAEDNIQVCCLTTPGQYFHALRRQMHRSFRKPLVLMQPKSLLRHKLSTSSVEDLTKGRFHEVIDDASISEPKKVKRVVLCSGKVYFDILEGREGDKANAVAIVRVEQLHPLPGIEIEKVLDRYENAKEVFWVQEEPKNQGALNYIEDYIAEFLPSKKQLTFIGREPSASTAVGNMQVHQADQKRIVQEALGL